MEGPAPDVFPGVLFLGGIKHSGKTTLGGLLAENAGVPFYDSDELTVAAARRRGLDASTARELYRLSGPEGFKRHEAEALSQLLAPGPRRRMVVALGGGAADNADALEVIDRNGYLIYLHVEADVLYERIMRRGTPAFLTSERPYEEFRKLFERRDTAYKKRARVVVELTGLGVTEAYEKTQSEIRRQLSGWK
jgi:shikimate kinase